MLHIDIICVGKIKEQYLRDAISEYSKRLSKYCSLKIIELSDEQVPNNLNDSIAQNIKQTESNNILSHIKKDSYVICLDLKGKQYTSEEFSKKIENLFITGELLDLDAETGGYNLQMAFSTGYLAGSDF